MQGPGPKYLVCNVINYLPYINVMIKLRLGNECPPIPIQSVPHRSAIPIWLTIDNKIVTCWIIMGLEVKSVLIVKRESAIWTEEITGDPITILMI